MEPVIVVGGGPVGLSAALAMSLQHLSVQVLEAQAESGGRDPRVLALSYGARLILERLGAWAHIAAPNPIRTVHVSQRGRFGHARLHAEDLGVDALGYVVAQADLTQALRRRTHAAGIESISGAHVTRLEERSGMAVVHFEHAGRERELCGEVVVQADGGPSLIDGARAAEHQYGQFAVVAGVRCERAARDCAYERFTGRGPIALLPFDGHHALIWTVPEDEASTLLALDDAAFERALADRYGERIGRVQLLGPRASFRLVLRFAHRAVGERHVLIGNAAQTLHPVAGQGFNIGLRDAFELAQALAEAVHHGHDLLAALRGYRSRRRLDRAGGTLFTDFLVRVFSNDDPLLGALRSAGLFAFDAAEPAKRFLMRRMIFGNPG